eukprot:scaffold5706_cov124-Isochrysis_galbana.AAC.6
MSQPVSPTGARRRRTRSGSRCSRCPRYAAAPGPQCKHRPARGGRRGRCWEIHNASTPPIRTEWGDWRLVRKCTRQAPDRPGEHQTVG